MMRPTIMIRAASILLALWMQCTASLADAVRPDVAYLANTGGYWQVWVMAPDGSGQRQVSRSAYDKNRVSWYPDGRFLLVNGNQGELRRLDIESGSETPISMLLKGMNDAVVSPDGTKIAFSLSTSGSVDDNNIWVTDASGANELKLTNMQGLQHEPTWSPDGKELYFLSGKGGQVHDIWKLTFATRAAEQLTTAALYQFDVAVGPNGSIAFSSNRSGNYEIWVWEKGGAPRQLTDHPAFDGKPAWSPDGEMLIFESSRSGSPNLWKISREGGEPLQLTRFENGARAPMWWQHGVSR